MVAQGRRMAPPFCGRSSRLPGPSLCPWRPSRSVHSVRRATVVSPPRGGRCPRRALPPPDRAFHGYEQLARRCCLSTDAGAAWAPTAPGRRLSDEAAPGPFGPPGISGITVGSTFAHLAGAYRTREGRGVTRGQARTGNSAGRRRRAGDRRNEAGARAVALGRARPDPAAARRAGARAARPGALRSLGPVPPSRRSARRAQQPMWRIGSQMLPSFMMNPCGVAEP
jgi:hypothetical protein